jgi:hypothetical protein
LRKSIKEKDDKIKNFTTQNDVLLEACTALSQQARELSQQNKETLMGVQQELHVVKAENAKLVDENCKLTRKVETFQVSTLNLLNYKKSNHFNNSLFTNWHIAGTNSADEG